MDLVEQATDYLENHAGELLVKGATALAIALVGFVLARVIAALAARAVRGAGEPRGTTLAPIVRTLTFLFLFGAALITALDHIGVDVAALVAGAGILGLALGFGAQTLVKDCLSGFFLILDDVLSEGDIVEVDGVSGTVELVGLRVTHIRAYSGQLWYVPNGEIQKVGNWNRAWVRAIVEVSLAYEQDVARGLAVLQRVGDDWANAHADIVLEPPEAQGVLGLNGSDIAVRLVIKIDNKGKDLWPAERELRALVKAAFDEEGVEIPFARQVVYHRMEEGQRLGLVDLKGDEGKRDKKGDARDAA